MVNRKRILPIVLSAIFSLVVLASTALGADTLSLKAISFSKNSLSISADGKITANVSRRTDPDRIVVDIKGAVLSNQLLQGKGQYSQTIDTDLVKTIRASSNFGLSPSTRIVIDLKAGADLKILSNNSNQAIIALTRVQSTAQSSPVESKPLQVAEKPVAEVPTPSVASPGATDSGTQAAKQPLTLSPPDEAPAQDASPPAEVKAPVNQSFVAQQKVPPVAKDISFEEKFSEENPNFVTINLKDADIKDVLQVFAQKAKLNLVMDPSVLGTITVNLKDVPLNEAMNLILKMNELEARKVGNTLIVANKKVFQEKGLDTTTAKSYRLNNAKADDAAKLISSSMPPGSRVTIVADLRTSSLIVTGTPEDLDKIDSIIKDIDSKAQQVLIEVKLIDLKAEDTQSLGVRYGLQQGQAKGGFNAPNVGIGGAGANTTNITFNSLANLTSAFSAEIDALVKANKAKVLANPKVATQDARPAMVNITEGVVTGETVTTTSGVGTVSTVTITQVGIKLEILPKIDHEGFITVDLKPNLTVRGDQLGVTSVSKIPIFSTVERSATTTLRVKNAETIVIGGLTREEKTTEQVKVPLLGDLPWLGGLFRSSSINVRNGEVVLLVTPYLVGDTTEQNATDAMEKAQKQL